MAMNYWYGDGVTFRSQRISLTQIALGEIAGIPYPDF